ncbi:MAG: DUF1573 domain-containing protein [Flavobacteriales bacterium]
MKNQIVFLTLATVALLGCKPKVKDGVGTELIDPEHPAIMTFKDTVYDFGTITQGQSVQFAYEFTNTGGSSLVINDVIPTCGCTVPQSWPRYPVKPGASAKIEVVFNSEGKSGDVQRFVKIVTNAKPSRKALVIKGKINAPKSN